MLQGELRHQSSHQLPSPGGDLGRNLVQARFRMRRTPLHQLGPHLGKQRFQV
jgi:hypothetical protein